MQGNTLELNEGDILDLVIKQTQQTAFGDREMLLTIPFTYEEVYAALLQSRTNKAGSKNDRSSSGLKRPRSAAGSFSGSCGLYWQVFTKGVWSNGTKASRDDAIKGLLEKFKTLSRDDYSLVTEKALTNLRDIKKTLSKAEYSQLEFLYESLGLAEG